MEKLDIEKFVDKEEHDFSEKCLAIAEDIKSQKYNILAVIENLGELFVNSSPSKRELGTSILTEVISRLTHDGLNDKELSVIVQFYIEKLNEHHQVVPVALRGILLMLDFKHFPKEKIPTILKTLFENVSCQQQQRIDRYNIYKIFEKLLDKFRTEILQMGLDFVYGVITSIDGERDPTNLLFLLKWLRKFLSIVPLGHLSDEMFDVIACYFPVDFKAPVTESNITRELLADALSPCLCGCPDFGEPCVELALEKLDSSLEIAKKDSLILLKEGCNNFPQQVYIENGTKIWWQLQKEIFSNPSEEVKLLSLETLTKVITVLSSDTNKAKEILKNISDTVKGNLLPDAKLFKLSIEVLLYSAKASKLSCIFIINEVIPVLTNTYKIDTNILNKIKLLSYSMKFCAIYHSFYSDGNEITESLHMLLLEAILHANDDLRAAGFYSAAEIAKFLSFEVREVIYTKISALIIHTGDSPLRKAILCCLKNMAIYHENEFRELVLNRVQIENSYSLDLYLNSLCVLSEVDSFKEFVVKTLIHHLADNTSISVKHTRIVLAKNDLNVIQLFLECNIIELLINIGLEYNSETATELLLNISAVLKTIIGFQNQKIQSHILTTFLDQILDSIHKSEWIVILLEGLAIRLRKDIYIDFKVLDLTLNLAINSLNDLVRDTSIQVFANMLNKRPIDGGFHTYICGLKDKFCSCLDTESKKNIFTAMCWTTKVLLLINYKDCNMWVDQILTLLDQNEDIASGFKIIMNDDYESLSVEAHCFKMSLYRQKFFIYVSNKLLENYTVDKTSYLKAIGYILQYAPPQAVQLHFKKIYRLIFLCLEKCTESEVLNILLTTINRILTDNSSILEDNVEDLLTRLLRLTTFETSMVVRIEALRCLVNSTTAFPIYKLLPLKRLVTDTLTTCLDDKKRLVRKEAMEARSLWFLIDAKD